MNTDAAAPAPTGEGAPLDTVDNTPATPSATPEITAEQVAQFLGTTTETLKSYQDFASNNGGWDKSLDNYKKIISGRQAQPAPAPTIQPSVNDSTTQTPPVTAQPPVKPVEGGMTQEEFLTQQYFSSLASREEYANIAGQMRNGEVLKEMSKFGIQPMVNGQFNDKKVRDFLDLYVKSQPAVTPAAPVTSTPTVEYVPVGEQITSTEEALRVLAQDRDLRAQGLAGHPRAKDADDFFNKSLSTYQNRGKVEHKPLDNSAGK